MKGIASRELFRSSTSVASVAPSPVVVNHQRDNNNNHGI